jgi:hypothetical protein
MKGAFHKENPHTLLELKKAIRNTTPIELSHVFARNIRRPVAYLNHVGVSFPRCVLN